MINYIRENIRRLLTPKSAFAEDYSQEVLTLYNEGLSHIKASNFKQSLVCFNKILKIEPKHAKARAIREKLIAKMEEIEKQSSPQVSEYDIEVWYNEGNAMLELGMYKEALDAFEKAIVAQPKNAVLWYRKAVVLNKTEKFEEAIECLECALEANAAFSDAWHLMSACYAHLNKLDEALKCLDKVIEIDPEHSPFAN